MIFCDNLNHSAVNSDHIVAIEYYPSSTGKPSFYHCKNSKNCSHCKTYYYEIRFELVNKRATTWYYEEKKDHSRAVRYVKKIVPIFSITLLNKTQAFLKRIREKDREKDFDSCERPKEKIPYALPELDPFEELEGLAAYINIKLRDCRICAKDKRKLIDVLFKDIEE